MSKREQCKAIMAKIFGPASAQMVDRLTEENCVGECKKKVRAFLGEEKAKLFDAVQ